LCGTEKTLIFLFRANNESETCLVCSNDKKFPFYNKRGCCNCKTETKYVSNIEQEYIAKTKIPTCRYETKYFINNDTCLTTEQAIGKKIFTLRMSKNLYAKTVASEVGIGHTTIYRYENGIFKEENIDVDVLVKLSVFLTGGKYAFLTDFLMFKYFKQKILSDYIIENNLSKKGLSVQLGVSHTLVKTWFNKEKRSPSYNLWQTAFKEYSLDWIKHNVQDIDNSL
jgi:hypothetical protein